MDDVLCDYSPAHADALRDDPETQYPQSVPGFFLNLKPIANSIQSVNELRERFDLYILTAPSIMNPHSYTEKRLWIEQYFGYSLTTKLIINPNKGLMKGDYLIDDRNEGRGQEAFGGELIHFGTSVFPDWETVMNYLIP